MSGRFSVANSTGHNFDGDAGDLGDTGGMSAYISSEKSVMAVDGCSSGSSSRILGFSRALEAWEVRGRARARIPSL